MCVCAMHHLMLGEWVQMAVQPIHVRSTASIMVQQCVHHYLQFPGLGTVASAEQLLFPTGQLRVIAIDSLP